jgi:hypothetical protein
MHYPWQPSVIVACLLELMTQQLRRRDFRWVRSHQDALSRVDTNRPEPE